MPCRVVIADDVDAARVLFRYALEADERIEVVAEAANGQEAVRR
jgi:DNA-binding NarL/FixJ family response regulator